MTTTTLFLDEQEVLISTDKVFEELDFKVALDKIESVHHEELGPNYFLTGGPYPNYR